MESTTHIPAHLYVSLLDGAQQGGNLPRYTGNPIQTGYGVSDFFSSLARTARRIIFPNLVRLGRAVVGDVFDGGKSPAESAQARTVEALMNIGEAVQRGEGRRKRRKPKKKTTRATPKKAKKARRTQNKRSTKAKKSVAKKTSRKRKSTSTVSLAKLLKRS